MSRPPKYSNEQILDAALAVLASGGPRATSVAAIARHLGGSSGSIYHRFPSRDVLMATLWLRTSERFQVGWLASLEQPDVRRAALAAAQHTLVWSREHPVEARLKLLYRREDVVAGDWPLEVADRACAARDARTLGLHRLLKRWPPGRAQPVALPFGLLAIPRGAVRGYLADGKPIPPTLDAIVARAVDAALFGG